MQRARLALLLLGTFTTATGVLIACSTDNGTTPIPREDAARPRSDGSSGGTSGGEEEEEQDAGPDAAGCDGGRSARSNRGVYCRSNAVDSDAGYCTVGDKTICCNDSKIGTQFEPGKCVAAEGECGFQGTGGREWHCTESDHCGGGQACCVIAGDDGTPRVFKDRCGERNNDANKKFVGGSRCKASCGTDELRLCAKDADCDGDKKCYFFDLSSRFTGVCE